MNNAFWFLIRRSTRNLIRTRLKRMRQPRYAIGTAFGLLYFGWVLGFGAHRSLAPLGRSQDAVQFVGTMVLFLMLALMWLWTSKKVPALGFTPAEVQHLFSAPITRQQLIWYRITRSQIAVLISAAFSTLLTRPSTVSGVVSAYVGLCLIFGAIGFHGMGMTLSRENLSKGGWRAAVRYWVPLSVILSSTALIVWRLWTAWPSLAALSGWTARISAADQMLSTGVAGVVLWPLHAMVRVPTAQGWTEFLWALPPAVLIWAVNAVWVVRSDAAFEEAAAEQAEKVATILRGRAPVIAPAKRRPAPFALAPAGRPEIAILWKNLISVSRASRAALITGVVIMLTVVIGMSVANDSSSLSEALGIGCLALAFMSLMNGPMTSRADLREDLAHLATIKTWPVTGAALVRAEVLAPTIVCSVITSSLFVMAAAIGGPSAPASMHVTPALLLSWTMAAILVASGLIAVQVVLQNGIAVLFPAWTRIGPRQAGSVEGMGRQMLMLFGSLIALPIVAIPAALAAAIVWIALQWTLGFVPVVVPAAIATAVLLAECWVATEAIGAALDRTDISAVDPV